ncbi:MAG: hypothetical protein AAFQ95_11875 [Cyanobacteria bacterium J06621_3]
MPKPALLEEGRAYTFLSYFEMQRETDEILAEFGIGFKIQNLALPTAEVDPEIAQQLRTQLQKRLERVLLSSEIARREALVSPILFEITELSDSQLRIEYALDVSEKLRGKLDYLVKGKSNFLVIEAKNDDTTRGFTQLAVELLALSIKEDNQKLLYGAVTTGRSWLFGCFDSEQQMVTQDTSIYAVPNALQELMAILLGIIQHDS